MIIKNARVFTEDGSFMQGDVVVKDGRFDSVLERTRLMTAHRRRL